MFRSSGEGWEDLTRKQAWDELEAVVLLQNAGVQLAMLEATGSRLPQREQYHARLIATHDAQGYGRLPARPQRVREGCSSGIPQGDILAEKDREVDL
jgi:hypothetical protein